MNKIKIRIEGGRDAQTARVSERTGGDARVKTCTKQKRGTRPAMQRVARPEQRRAPAPATRVLTGPEHYRQHNIREC